MLIFSPFLFIRLQQPVTRVSRIHLRPAALYIFSLRCNATALILKPIENALQVITL